VQPSSENDNLDAPFRQSAQLQRWNRATTDLFRAGLFKPDI